MFPLLFIKMLMTDDFGNKVIQFLIGLLVIIIVCFAWWTTNITEQPQYRTVFLLDRRLRRRTNRSRLTTHIQSTSIIAGTQVEETAVTENSQASASAQQSEANKPPEASTSSNTTSGDSPHHPEDSAPSSIEDEELETIVHIMDADTNVVRLRRLAYYANRQQGNGGVSREANASQATTSTEQSNSSQTTSSVEGHPEPPRSGVSTNSLAELSEERVEIVNEPIMEHNYAEREEVHANPSDEHQLDDTKSTGSDATTLNDESSVSNIRIKLKYLNDELKLVDGRLEEQLGDFKRRHFHLEFSSNKLVRLIFNGQVLQPDTETLQSCGLFDNCVVHCLIHQQRNVLNDPSSSSNNFASSNARIGSRGLLNGHNNNNNQGRDWDLGNVLFAFVSIILGSAWYFRYEYSHLYTVTATVALVAITGIFTIFLVGIYFPEPEPPAQRADHQSVPT